MGKIMRNGVEFSGNTAVIYRNGIPYISQGVPDYKIIPKTITLNGTYDPAQDNCDGYSNLVVDVPTSAPPVLKTKSITSNGTYNASADNADGYSQVTVSVNQATETKSITSNGTYTPSSGKIGFSSVSVNVNQSTETKSITSNGTYRPSSGKIGFSSVTVNVNQATEQKSITSNGTYTPSSGKIGFSKVTVSVPTSSRVTVWSGSSAGNVSVNLSAYKWVYITIVTGSDYPGVPEGRCLLQVGGSSAAGGAVGRNWSWGFTNCDVGPFNATTSGIAREFGSVYGNTLYITSVVGISNLS